MSFKHRCHLSCLFVIIFEFCTRRILFFSRMPLNFTGRSVQKKRRVFAEQIFMCVQFTFNILKLLGILLWKFSNMATHKTGSGSDREDSPITLIAIVDFMSQVCLMSLNFITVSRWLLRSSFECVESKNNY